MSGDKDSTIRENAREQLKAERQTDKLRDILHQLSNQLVEDSKDASSIKQKRMALEEVRKVKSDLKEETQDMRKISENSLEDLFDEFVRLIEERKEERDAGETEATG